MRRLRAGLSGCGGVSRWTLDVAAKSPDFEIVAVQDVDGSALERTARSRRIAAAFRDFQALLAQDLDFVILNTPNHLHLPQLGAVLERGLPCLVQKPVARDAREAERMLAMARKARRKVGVTMMELGNPLVWQLRDMLRAGVFGKPVHIEAIHAHDHYLKAPPARGNWRLDARRVGGASFIQLAVHHLNLAAWLLGRPVAEASALGVGRLHTRFPVDETTAAAVRFEGGAIGTFASSYATFANRLAVHGTEGYFRLSHGRMAKDALEICGARPFRGEVFAYASPGKERRFGGGASAARLRRLAPRYEVHNRFARWISRNEPYPAPLPDAVRDMRALDAVYRSVESGKSAKVRSERRGA